MTTERKLPSGLVLPINSRLQDQLSTMYEIAKAMKSASVTHMLVNGDVFHIRGIVPVEVYQHVYDLFWHIRHTLKIHVAILVGNHDQSDRNGLIHSVYGLKELVTVVDKPGKLTVNDVEIYCIPYIADKKQLQAELDKGSGTILFAHLGVDGAAVGPVEHRIKDPIKVADLHPERYKYVLLGHYHKPQHLAENVWFIGSPWQINRGEVGDEKRWILLDTKVNGFHSNPTNAREFRTVTSSEFVAAEDRLLTDYYDILMDSFTSVEEVKAKAHGKHIKFLFPKQEQEDKRRIVMDESMTDEQLLAAYIKYVKAESPAKLLNLGLQLLRKVETAAPNNTRLSFLRVVIDNFLTLKHADLKLHQPGSVIAVQGQNLTSDGFTSNGAGKSSLLPESILWCLWGCTARDIPVDKVVNRRAKRNCSVTLVLLAGNRKLEVTRYRKHTKLGGDGLRLIVDGRDCTEGTPRLTQQRLNNEIGVDFVTATSVIAFSPDTLRFVSETDANQKQVLDSILQTRRFTAAQEVAKNALSVVRGQYVQAQADLDNVWAGIEELQATLAEYNLMNESWQQREQERKAGIRQQIQQVTAERDETNLELSTQQDNLAHLENRLQSLKDTAQDVDAIEESYTQAVSAVLAHQATMKAKQEKLDEYQSLLDTAVEMAGKPCPTCGQAVSNTGKLISSYQGIRNRLARELKSLEATKIQLSEHRNQCLTARVIAKSNQQNINQANLEIQKTRTDITRLEGILAGRQERIQELSRQLKTVPVNEYDVLISKIKAKIDAQTVQHEDLKTQVDRHAAQQGRIQFWISAFGNGGIRSFLLDQIIPQLTEYANDYTARLGENLQIQFHTHREGASTDKFSISAVNADGADLYKGNSSGERRRVDVAVLMAMFRVAYNRTRLNVLLLDEVLDTLDSAGLEAIIDMLRDVARDLKLTIYVTSHVELTRYLQESITLVKQNGVSTLQIP